MSQCDISANVEKRNSKKRKKKNKLTSHCSNIEIIYYSHNMGIDARKPVFGGLRTTQAQTGQRLCYSLKLESIISKLASSEISIFRLVCVAVETGLSLALSETPKTDFLATRPNNDSGPFSCCVLIEGDATKHNPCQRGALLLHTLR